MRTSFKRTSAFAAPFIFFIALVLMAPASASEVVKVTGEGNKVLLLDDGSVITWKNAKDGLVKVKLPAKAVDIASGARQYAVLEDGSLYSWDVQNNEAASQFLAVKDVKNIQVAGATVLVLLRDGQVMAWGPRGSGLIGDGLHPKRYLEDGPPAKNPVLVPNVSRVIQLSVGYSHALALTEDHRVLAWGSNFYGALGREPRRELPIDSAEEIPGLGDVVAVVAGNGVSSALKKDGTVWVWGANWHAQFGNGDRTDPPGVGYGYVLTPQQVKGINNVTHLTLGLAGRHTMVLLKDGSLRAWGNTDWGQIGAGVSGTFQEKPVTPKINNIKSVFAVGNNTFAVKKDGSFWAWGSGDRGSWPFTKNTKIPEKIEIPSN